MHLCPNYFSRLHPNRSGLTREFALNGLKNANSLFGFELFNIEKYEYVSIYNELEGRHEAYFQVLDDQELDFGHEFKNVTLVKGQMIQFEYSYKYSQAEVDEMVHKAGLSMLGKFTDSENLYDLHLFYKSPFSIRDIAADDQQVPQIKEWHDLFKARLDD